MVEFQTKLKRQIEILGTTLADRDEPLRAPDLAQQFGVEELTIKRDLNDLRSYGIDIHSTKREGISLATHIPAEKLSWLILQYVGLCFSGTSYDKSTALMVQKLKHKALPNIVALQGCIEHAREAEIDYEKETREIEKNRAIKPMLIFQSENYWRVLAINDGKVKQYHLNKILDVRPTLRPFKRMSREEIDNHFKYAWRSWIGTDQFEVTLRFSKEWASRLIPRQLMEHQHIQHNEDGSVIFKTTVNSLEEMASWVVSRGEGVLVVGPVSLREKVVGLARAALANYGC